jgi:hypothetical protein
VYDPDSNLKDNDEHNVMQLELEKFLSVLSAAYAIGKSVRTVIVKRGIPCM